MSRSAIQGYSEISGVHFFPPSRRPLPLLALVALAAYARRTGGASPKWGIFENFFARRRAGLRGHPPDPRNPGVRRGERVWSGCVCVSIPGYSSGIGSIEDGRNRGKPSAIDSRFRGDGVYGDGARREPERVSV